MGHKEIERCDYIKKVVSENYAKVDRVERYGMKQVYKVTLSTGQNIKARIIKQDPPYLRYHRALEDKGLNMPKILKRIYEKEEITLTEWIKGICHFNAINSHLYIKTIPARHYELWGEYLAEMGNTVIDGKRVAPGNLIWPQFIIDKDEKIWLIDDEILRLDKAPERWIIHVIVYHPYTSREQKEAFIKGYLSKYEKRDFTLGLEMTEKFIKELRCTKN